MVVQWRDVDKPNKAITTYDFGVFESENDYTVYFVGLYSYVKGKDSFHTRIDFEPLNMFFPLPKSEFQNLDREQVLAKVKVQLKDFTNSEKFKTSFFAQAKSIKFSSNGEIWSK